MWASLAEPHHRGRLTKPSLCKGGCRRSRREDCLSFTTPPSQLRCATSPSQGRGGLDIKLCRHHPSISCGAAPQGRLTKPSLCKGGCRRSRREDCLSFTTPPSQLRCATSPSQGRGGLDIKLCRHHPGISCGAAPQGAYLVWAPLWGDAQHLRGYVDTIFYL